VYPPKEKETVLDIVRRHPTLQNMYMNNAVFHAEIHSGISVEDMLCRLILHREYLLDAQFGREKHVKELQRQIMYLRHYGNKYCLDMAEAAMQEGALEEGALDFQPQPTQTTAQSPTAP
jgi:hypothetical protein